LVSDSTRGFRDVANLNEGISSGHTDLAVAIAKGFHQGENHFPPPKRPNARAPERGHLRYDLRAMIESDGKVAAVSPIHRAREQHTNVQTIFVILENVDQRLYRDRSPISLTCDRVVAGFLRRVLFSSSKSSSKDFVAFFFFGAGSTCHVEQFPPENVTVT